MGRRLFKGLQQSVGGLAGHKLRLFDQADDPVSFKGFERKTFDDVANRFDAKRALGAFRSFQVGEDMEEVRMMSGSTKKDRGYFESCFPASRAFGAGKEIRRWQFP